MSQSVKQSVKERLNTVTNVTEEVITTLLKSKFQITETTNPNDANLELRHWRASAIRWQHDGSILINARNRENFAPNAGFIHTHSTGQTYVIAEHNVLISAKGYAKTGGGEGWVAKRKKFRTLWSW